MSDQVFPPTSWQDIAAYDNAECVEGLLDFLRGEPEPGGNRSPSYRWGWITGRADRHGADQFDALRHQYARIKIGKAA